MTHRRDCSDATDWIRSRIETKHKSRRHTVSSVSTSMNEIIDIAIAWLAYHTNNWQRFLSYRRAVVIAYRHWWARFTLHASRTCLHSVYALTFVCSWHSPPHFCYYFQYCYELLFTSYSASCQLCKHVDSIQPYRPQTGHNIEKKGGQKKNKLNKCEWNKT